MLSWQELDRQFQDLAAPLKGARLDIQWGAAGEYLSLSGYFDVEAKSRFMALARLAGEKLPKCLPRDADTSADILNEPDPVKRWWRALWHLSPSFTYGFAGFQSASGEDLGAILTGSVRNPASASATLSLDILARFGEPTSSSEDARNWLQRVGDSVGLKPGLYGFSIDLKKLFKRKK